MATEDCSDDPNFLPVEKSQFKPRTDKLRCQYCSYTNNYMSNVNRHVNSKHELTQWYKCLMCPYDHHFVGLDPMQKHMKGVHKTSEHNFEKVEDEKELETLRRSRIAFLLQERMILKETRQAGGNAQPNSNSTNAASFGASRYIPIERSQFLPRLKKLMCQYCGYFSSDIRCVDSHINTQHEMTKWYKCKLCDDRISVSHESLKKHLRQAHHLTAANNYEKIEDVKEIEALRKAKIEEHFSNRFRNNPHMDSLHNNQGSCLAKAKSTNGLSSMAKEQSQRTTGKKSFDIRSILGEETETANSTSNIRSRSKAMCESSEWYEMLDLDRSLTGKVNSERRISYQPEVMTLYKCKLCQLNPFDTRSSAEKHLRDVHQSASITENEVEVITWRNLRIIEHDGT